MWKNSDLAWVVLTLRSENLGSSVYGHQMVAVNYGPVVTLIRDWRPYSWIHTHAHKLTQLDRGKAICSPAN